MVGSDLTCLEETEQPDLAPTLLVGVSRAESAEQVQSEPAVAGGLRVDPVARDAAALGLAGAACEIAISVANLFGGGGAKATNRLSPPRRRPGHIRSTLDRVATATVLKQESVLGQSFMSGCVDFDRLSAGNVQAALGASVTIDVCGATGMSERRSVERRRVNEAGLIAVDEHTSIPCLVYDVSVGGARLTLPNAEVVPATFILDAPCLARARVCVVMWRSDECIGAQFQRAGG